MKKSLSFTTLLSLAFALVALLFVSSTVLVTWFSSEIEARNEAVTTNALPSIVHLNAANDALRDLEMMSDDYPDVTDPQREATRAAIENKWKTVDTELTTYLSFPSYPGERELYEATVPGALRDVNTSVNHLLSQSESHETAGARTTADREVGATTARASRYLRNMVDFDATHAEQDLARIDAAHRRATRTAIILDAGTIVFVVFLAVWVRRRFLAHDKLVLDHSALLEQRSAELEVFGQRVAHDLLSPLSALTYCLGAFKRVSETDPKLADALTRARACVGRAQDLVHGIFDFARAGGAPQKGAHADLHEVLERVKNEMEEAEIAVRPEIVVEPFSPCAVACSPGVLTSILTNLMRNAAKFMSDSAVRKITVRVREKGARVRVEVQDTGPGVPRGLEARIFEPYVRAEGATQPGLGLGLATVKKLCESHGGAVTVSPNEPHGSVFRVTLPAATDVIETTPSVSGANIRLVR